MFGRNSLAGTEEVWKEIPTSLLNSLTRSMPRRIAAVIKAEGRYSKYQCVFLLECGNPASSGIVLGRYIEPCG